MLFQRARDARPDYVAKALAPARAKQPATASPLARLPFVISIGLLLATFSFPLHAAGFAPEPYRLGPNPHPHPHPHPNPNPSPNPNTNPKTTRTLTLTLALAANQASFAQATGPPAAWGRRAWGVLYGAGVALFSADPKPNPNPNPTPTPTPTPNQAWRSSPC